MRRITIALATTAVSVFGLFGASSASAAPVATNAAGHYCGTACNGKPPQSTVTLLDGARVVCNDSAVLVGGPYNPRYSHAGTTITDLDIQGGHYYSTVCQTTWLRVQSTSVWRAETCKYVEFNSVTRAQWTQACPAPGGRGTTAMIDDHDPNGAAINYGYLEETSGGLPFAFTTNTY
jgi:hypothetical protein